ncbi:SAF domain-containing protein [Amycolatopsis japonica]|uniref:SAF domain-containing protein n=1 Tax=Amycolatopsis japonica TaxID=208439 RepID=A0A075UVW5_9PSEU|nr:SAF domain-containing protein [Amycolatopsis japonica]AIG74380.1 SAF domain-containing protein [Amycolatopsis japonica]
MGTALSFSRPPRAHGSDPAFAEQLGDDEPPRVPRRRRWWLLGVAVVLAAVVAFGNYALIAGQDDRVDVLALTREVSWGQTIGEGDLGVVKAVPDQSLAFIPVGDKARVVGQVARSLLSAGTVLAPGQLSGQPIPGPGERLVGLPVRPGHLPARGLSAGDLVQVTPIAVSNGPDVGQSPASTSGPFRARVLGVGPPDSTGAVTVDVVVVGADAAHAATSASAGQVVLVQLGPGA